MVLLVYNPEGIQVAAFRNQSVDFGSLVDLLGRTKISR